MLDVFAAKILINVCTVLPLLKWQTTIVNFGYLKVPEGTPKEAVTTSHTVPSYSW